MTRSEYDLLTHWRVNHAIPGPRQICAVKPLTARIVTIVCRYSCLALSRKVSRLDPRDDNS